jgi:glycosyltransferase involved in cell wall biosynthesis
MMMGVLFIFKIRDIGMAFQGSNDIKQLKICFIAPNAYPLITKTKPNNVIGPDLDQVTIAEALHHDGYEISFITYYDNDFKGKEFHNMSLIKMHDPNSKINIFSKVFNIWKSLKKADSDIYFHYGDFMGLTSIFAFINGKKSVYRIGSDFFVNKGIVKEKIREFSNSKFSIRSIGNWIDIKLADAVCVQTEYQYNQLKQNYGKKGIIIKNHIKLKNYIEKKPEKFIALWVGSIAEVKQPQLFLKLAKKLPKISFWMIGGSIDQLDEKFIKCSKDLGNFKFFGAIPPSEIDEYYKKASVLINTSIFEGFPNSFIQAWMYYSPVISLNADPDGIITQKNMGFHSKSYEQLEKDLEILVENKDLRIEMGSNGRNYVFKEHDIVLIAHKYKTLIDKL